MGKGEIIVVLILFNIILITFIFGIIAFVKQYRLKKKLHLQEIENIDKHHKQEILQSQVEIQTETMKHIGREIHDNIGQKLTLASLYVQQLLLENKEHLSNEKAGKIGSIIDNSLHELRQLSKSLTNDTIEKLTLIELIEEECKKINNLKECQVSFKNDAKKDKFTYQAKSIIFRITQEFIQNSIKHAQCNNITVELTDNNNGIILSLKDDGKGFTDIDLNNQGIGLRNMKKRAQLIGGDFNLESVRGIGTKLTVNIPFR